MANDGSNGRRSSKEWTSRSSPALPLYVGDFLRDTQTNNEAQDGVYLRLLMAYWAHGRPLPNDDEKLAAIARVPVDKWLASYRATMLEYFTIDGDVWRQKRMDREISYLADKLEKSRLSALNRWGSVPDVAGGSRAQRLAHARRAGSHSRIEWEELKAILGHRCVRCGAQGRELQKERIVPPHKDGSNAIDNIQPTCSRCIILKRSDYTDYRPRWAPDWREKLTARVTGGEYGSRTVMLAVDALVDARERQRMPVEASTGIHMDADGCPNQASTGIHGRHPRTAGQEKKGSKNKKKKKSAVDAYEKHATSTSTSTSTLPGPSGGTPPVPPVTGTAAPAGGGGLTSQASTTNARPVTAETWDAYRSAYVHRYGVEPVRNATVNAQLGMLVKRVGHDAAPHVAAFYVTVNHSFYVQKSHSVGPMVKDAEALHTQWRRHAPMTVEAARQADRTASNAGAFGALLEEARSREGGSGGA